MNKLATSTEGRENYFMPIRKRPWFLDQKLPPKSDPKNVLKLLFLFFLIQSQIELKYSHCAFFLVVFNGNVRPPKFLTHIDSWDEKGCIRMYRGSEPFPMKEHLQSSLKGSSHRQRSQSDKNIFKSWPFFMQGVRPQTSRDHFPTKVFL